MQIGPVYRLQVTDIPNNPGVEIFPTVEVIDRLYPPPGLALRFPIPIELTQDELEMAARGTFVTRVIYVEDPSIALPVRQRRTASSRGSKRRPAKTRWWRPIASADRWRSCASAAACRLRRRAARESPPLSSDPESCRRSSRCTITRHDVCANPCRPLDRCNCSHDRAANHELATASRRTLPGWRPLTC